MESLSKFAENSQLGTMCTFLAALMVLDVITGLTAATINKEASSTRMKDGLLRKLLVFVVVFVAVLMQYVYPPIWSGTAMAMWYCGVEALSILEKCGKAGIPMPQQLLERLAKLNGSESTSPDRPNSLMNINIKSVEANMPVGTVMPVVNVPPSVAPSESGTNLHT